MSGHKHIHIIPPHQPDVLPHSPSGVAYTIAMMFGVLILAIACLMLDMVGSKSHEMRTGKMPTHTDQ